jgi:cellulose synthase/poly-beta-1,6-N-acetylglucosamine synthase-like glycosyltransferase
MKRHSLFFQGNDVEVGLLAEDELSYVVGHIDFEVETDVPETPKSWWRQRYAWAGGEWRLAITNIRFAKNHPFLFLYVTGVSLAMCPLRWYA